ncbi:MAG: hypothetical protein ABI330_22265 [Caldimonas sp.]
MLRKLRNCLEYPVGHETGGNGIVSGEKRGFFVEVGMPGRVDFSIPGA